MIEILVMIALHAHACRRTCMIDTGVDVSIAKNQRFDAEYLTIKQCRDNGSVQHETAGKNQGTRGIFHRRDTSFQGMSRQGIAREQSRARGPYSEASCADACRVNELGMVREPEIVVMGEIDAQAARARSCRQNTQTPFGIIFGAKG